ncbi:triose-phosphate isomerase [Caldisericum exile]|uniref:Triosephosphate isomerase n=1 Tax=Caldisericum exile (strain DSM 21853 / NBRC 104410 / AZM16c01) TaxID=511051 RepID=A0A7U6JG30_CALEA|nr:triose-phosphate isomerase [Caldisericum exile]BAL80945.1 triosephosphate isomerase [Caldisericum exile AZM16c01]
MKKYFLFGNWKMHKTIKETLEYADCLKGYVEYNEKFEIGVFPPFTALESFAKTVRSMPITVGAQNMHYEEKGAFTGEISPLMLKEIGVKYVLIGHSERRHIFKEDNGLINKKVLSAINHELVPVLCIGETLEERKSNKTESVIKEQIEQGLNGVNSNNFIIAYEPVWAIGTGVNATPEQAREVHKFIRELLFHKFGESSNDISILYGGSIKVDNFGSLAEVENIDGGLVGGASLDCSTFIELYEILKSKKLK